MEVRTCFLDETTIAFNDVAEYRLTFGFSAKYFVDFDLFVTVSKKSKSNIFGRIVFVIIQ